MKEKRTVFTRFISFLPRFEADFARDRPALLVYEIVFGEGVHTFCLSAKESLEERVSLGFLVE